MEGEKQTAPESRNQTLEGDRLTAAEQLRMQIAKNRLIHLADPAA